MVWLNMNDVLRVETEMQTDWAFKHMPILCEPTRGGGGSLVVKWVSPHHLPLDTETTLEAVMRLTDLGYTRIAVAEAVDRSVSRVAQILKEEREHVGLLES